VSAFSYTSNPPTGRIPTDSESAMAPVQVDLHVPEAPHEHVAALEEHRPGCLVDVGDRVMEGSRSIALASIRSMSADPIPRPRRSG
jgi:hypothetical protein